MIFVKMKGRLGNQMFQYAIARAIQVQNKSQHLVFDWSLVDERHEMRNDGWCNNLRLFKTALYSDGDEKQLPLVMRVRIRLYHFLRAKGKRLLNVYEAYGQYLFRRGIIMYQNFRKEVYPKAKNIYIEGYYEDSRFFSNIIDELRCEFKPQKSLEEKNKHLYECIVNTESICVSIRRGDFFSGANASNIGACCSERYYYNGVDYIREKVPSAVVIVFSDEIDWVKNHLRFEGEVYYEDGTDNVAEKLRLMSSCKHFVISNSTFSWWAQQLATNEDKIVVAPKKWRMDNDEYSLLQAGWKLM